MKLSRSELKAIVKECLVEILTDGLGSTVNESRKPRPISRTPKFDPMLDTPVSKTFVATPKVNTGNPIFDDILNDTARTTLRTMTEAESSRSPQPAGTIERIVEDSSPVDLFGDEAASKWASLAFSEPVSKTSR